ncbi:MAG: hypothetical protein GEU87_10335 [Alphaproteobacteria bacterium]|nr:hypothetical protein [Alphaproteobacteria bacterium]
MTEIDPRIAITEIDLLGYADGLLDADPVRKRAVEAFLRAHPAEAERVAAYIEQNREIQRLYGPIINEPLPERLQAILHRERGDGAGRGHWLRAAASVAILLAAGAGGWLMGFEQRQTPSVAESFVEQALANHPQMRQAEPAMPHIDRVSAGGILERPPEAALELDPPDLSALGYTFQNRRIVGSGSKQMAQMTYERTDGRRLSLFLGSRWRPADRKMVFSHDAGVTMAHWLDGPVIYGVVAEGGEPELAAVADTIKAAARQARRGAPRIAIQGGAHTIPLDDTALSDDVVQPRLVTPELTPEPAVAVPRKRIGPIRATR